MAEQLNSQRAFFPPGKQREFIVCSRQDLNITWGTFAATCSTSVRNLSDWRNEKNSMSLVAVKNICQKRKITIPAHVIIRDAYWYVTKGARAGGQALVAKYGIVGGDPEIRKQKWRKWWEKEGKFKISKITQPLPFNTPVFSSELAEFVGILLGDGGISEHQITITLNSVTDKEYLVFVQRLIKHLFKVPTGIYSDKQALAKRISISRTALVLYLTTIVGLKKGNKVQQQVDIPQWIKENPYYATACLRGLIDTDGCIILHQYRSKNKRYSYKKIGFTSRSYPLLSSASTILLNLGIKHRIMKNRWDIRIEAEEEVAKYFRLVGTSNPKHWKRYTIAR